MTTIAIKEDLLLTVSQVADMLGLDQKRVQYLLADTDLVPSTKTLGDRGHFRVRFGDLDKVIEADEKTRKIGRNKKPLVQIENRVSELEERIEMLERIVDEFTAREVASTS